MSDPENPPLVSAVLTCFNTGSYLHDGVASVRREMALCAQQGVAVEFIAVDDHSSDAATLVLLDALQSSDSPPQLLRLPRNQGVSAARNAGAAAARGTWLAFLDGDDAWTEGTLLAHLQAAQAQPALQWLSCDHQRMDADGTPIAGSQRRSHALAAAMAAQPTKDGALQVLSRPIHAALHVVGRPLHAALSEFLCHVDSTLVRRDLFQAVGGFDTTLRSAEDHDLWLRLAERADLGYADRNGALYRTNSNSITTTTRMPHPHLPLVYQRASQRLQGDHPDLARFAAQRFRETVLENIHHCRRHGQFGLAREQAALLLRSKATKTLAWKHLLAATLRMH